MSHCRPFLSGVDGLGSSDSAYGADAFSSGVKSMQVAMQRLAKTWPAAMPTRTDGILDQGTVQVLVNIIGAIPQVPSSIASVIRISGPLLIGFGWDNSKGRQVRVQIKNAAGTIAPAITAFAMKRELSGQGQTAPNVTGAGAAGAAPMSLGLKIGIGLGVGGIVLLLALR